MKYWYLKSGDVAGPTEPAKIMADTGFDMSVLVCPEPYSEDETYWKSASQYARDFGLYGATADTEIPFPGEETIALEKAARKKAPAFDAAGYDSTEDANLQPELLGELQEEQNRLAQAKNILEEVSPEDTIHGMSPVTATLDDNLLEELPAESLLQPGKETSVTVQAPPPLIEVREPIDPTEEYKATSILKPQIKAKKGKEVKKAPAKLAATSSAPLNISIKDEPSVVLSLIDKIPSHDPYQMPPGSLFEEMGADATSQEHEDADAFPIGRASKQTVTPDHSATAAPAQSNTLIPMKGRLIASTNPTLNGAIINSLDSNGRTANKPRNDIVYILVFVMFVIMAIAVFMTFFKDNKIPPPQSLQSAIIHDADVAPSLPAPVAQGIEEGVPSPAYNMPRAQLPLPGAAASDKENEAAKADALNIVRKYLLDAKRGSIEDYFNKSFEGYQTIWTASPLYGDTYIVEFFASKVRKEPIIYQFRVDVKNKKLTGALNNITLDLLSK